MIYTFGPQAPKQFSNLRQNPLNLNYITLHVPNLGPKYYVYVIGMEKVSAKYKMEIFL
jgi:hypothetical protein